jgi:hypothetical protein
VSGVHTVSQTGHVSAGDCDGGAAQRVVQRGTSAVPGTVHTGAAHTGTQTAAHTGSSHVQWHAGAALAPATSAASASTLQTTNEAAAMGGKEVCAYASVYPARQAPPATKVIHVFMDLTGLPYDMHEHVLAVLKDEVAATEGRFGGAVALLALVMLRRTCRGWHDHALLAPEGQRHGLPRLPWHKRSRLVVAARVMAIPLELAEPLPVSPYRSQSECRMDQKDLRMRAYLRLPPPPGISPHAWPYRYQQACMGSLEDGLRVKDALPGRHTYQWRVRVQRLPDEALQKRMGTLDTTYDEETLCLHALWRYHRHAILRTLERTPPRAVLFPARFAEELVHHKADMDLIKDCYRQHHHDAAPGFPINNAVRFFISWDFVSAAIRGRRVDVLQWCWDDPLRRDALHHTLALDPHKLHCDRVSSAVLVWLRAHVSAPLFDRLTVNLVLTCIAEEVMTLPAAQWLDAHQLFRHRPDLVWRIRASALCHNDLPLAAWCHAKSPVWPGAGEPDFMQRMQPATLAWAVARGLRLGGTPWAHDLWLSEHGLLSTRKLCQKHPANMACWAGACVVMALVLVACVAALFYWSLGHSGVL